MPCLASLASAFPTMTYKMSDHDGDTEPYEDETSSSDKMRYLETSTTSTTSRRTILPYTPRVRRARRRILSLRTAVPVTPKIVEVDTGFTVIITVYRCITTKTPTTNFPINEIHFTLSNMQRGENITLKYLDVPNLWAVGWHDHHYNLWTPGKPDPKRRQDIEGNNLLK
jgi:hypothetical protein